MKRNRLQGVVGAMICLAVASVSRADAFQNGGFESGAFAPGWTVTQGNGVVTSGAYCCGVTGPGEGTYYAALSGGGDALTTIAQTFDTIPGQLYTVSFLLNGANGGEQLGALVQDSTPSTLASHSYLVTSGSYVSHSFTFVPDTTSSTLSFTDNQPNGATDAILDGITVTTPEPGALALLALAAAPLLRRRRA